MNILVGLIFITLGLVSIIRPKIAFDLRTFIARQFMGMKVKASEKTYHTYQMLGVLYIIVGIILLLNF